VVKCDSTKKEDLLKVFQGAFGVFSMTPVIPPGEKENELLWGKLQIDTALEAGVKHLVWSGLENVEAISKGRFDVPHFTYKSRVEEYARSLKSLSFTAVYLAYFFTNFIEYYVPVKDADGALVFGLPADPNKVVPWTDSTKSLGPVAAEIFSNPAKYNGKVIPIIDDEKSPQQMTEIFTKVTGVPAKFRQIPKEEWLTLPFPPGMADEIFQMWEYSQTHGYFKEDRDKTLCRSINPQAANWEQFLKESGWRGQPFAEWKQKNM